MSSVRPWVKRLGSYLRIFGFPNHDQPEGLAYLEHLESMAREREAEHGHREALAGDAV